MTDHTKAVLRFACLVAVITNLIVFLTLSYCNKLHMADEARSAIFIDFWGRWTVYSLWFMMYEVYRTKLCNKSAT